MPFMNCCAASRRAWQNFGQQVDVNVVITKGVTQAVGRFVKQLLRVEQGGQLAAEFIGQRLPLL